MNTVPVYFFNEIAACDLIKDSTILLLFIKWLCSPIGYNQFTFAVPSYTPILETLLNLGSGLGFLVSLTKQDVFC